MKNGGEDKAGVEVGCETNHTITRLRWADLAPASFSEESCEAWQELCVETDRRANLGEVAEVQKGHTGSVGSRVQRSGGQQGQPREQEREQEKGRWTWGPRLLALCHAAAWWVFAAPHQPCTEEECPGHRSSEH